jgi:predicted transcriptional regulator
MGRLEHWRADTCPSCGAELFPSPTEIRWLRQALGVSQFSLALSLGVQPCYIALLESGKRRMSLALTSRFRNIERANASRLKERERNNQKHQRVDRNNRNHQRDDRSRP